MSILTELGQAAQAGVALPEVIADRCVHTLAEIASCTACLDACPQGAWIIDEEMLGIDEARCDGCDLCVPACPQGAIVTRFSPARRKSAGKGVALAHCARSTVTGAREALMPCVHAIATVELLRLYRDGTRYVITSAGDCARCERGAGVSLKQRIEQINGLLSDRGQEPLIHRQLSATPWLQIWDQVNESAAKGGVSRRAFFRNAIKAPAERLEEALETLHGAPTPPGVLLPRLSPSDRLPFAPAIDAARCNGCDACVQLCPHGAIALQEDEGASCAYRILPEQCTGCALCADVCEQQAVGIEPWGRVKREQVALQAHRCPACGVRFHVPREREAPTGRLCRICTQVNHHKNLYQVLD
ncbi:MAG: 4Fe-4S binding protein [Pseudomonadota bacterium]|nr:4Fe-4S binding protein [Pseudomonadota bacterium]